MSVFNKNPYLEKSILSVLQQSYNNIEFLIMNDGSTDNTIEILEKLKEKEERIKIFENKTNLGLTKSLNILSKFSTGEYIARQDADDISYSLRLEKQLEYMELNNLHACTTYAKSLQSNQILHSRTNLIPLRILLKFKNPFIHGSMLINKSVFDDLGKYNEKYYYAQDYKLFTDMFMSKYRVKILKKFTMN